MNNGRDAGRKKKRQRVEKEDTSDMGYDTAPFPGRKTDRDAAQASD
jgi:hypothetical protein